MSSPAGTTRRSADDEAVLDAMARDLAAGREIRLPHRCAADVTGSVAVTVDGDGRRAGRF
jgi:hypothetical protein